MTAPASSRRWWILGVIGIAQLMVVLDNSIVNIALPSAQAELGFSDAQRQWVVTAYALAFGSLLLLGGRLSDMFGRKATFVTGLIGFAAVSVLGGLAPDFSLLVSARALQGVFGAVLAPAALSLLTTTFPSGRERATAFGVFSALAGSGAAIGVLLGGALTEYVDWRWSMYVNAVFAVVAMIGALVLLPAHSADHRPRLDLVGTVTASLGFFGVVFGFATAETEGWGSPTVYAFLAGGVVVLIGFVLIQRRVASPLLPLRVLLDRFRGGSYLTVLVLTTGMFGVGLFLAYIMEQVLGFSPVLTGVSFLPMVASIVTASNTMPRIALPRIGPKPLIVVGLLVAAGGLFWFSFLTPAAHYGADILGPMILIGLGMGTGMSASINTATLGVDPADAGVASATTNTMQQVGGSVGTALLSSIAGTVSASLAASGVTTSRQEIALHGYDAAFLVSAGIFVVGAVVLGFLIPWGRPHRAPATATSAESAEHPEPAHDRPLAPRPTTGPVLVGTVTGAADGGASLTLVGSGRAPVDRVFTDDSGAFRLAADRPGTYLLVVNSPGASPLATWVRLDTATPRQDLHLVPAAAPVPT